jgi:CRP-like cAMP-binding protein
MPELTDIDKLIARCKLFCDLSESDRKVVGQTGNLVQINSKDFFYHQGADATKIYLLLEGRIKLIKVTADGHQVLARFLNPGKCFGLISVHAKADYPFSAQAVDNCSALAWENVTLQNLLLRFPGIAFNALLMMMGQCREWQRRYEEIVTECVEQRIAQAILRLARQVGRRIKEGVLIDLPLSRQDLGEMTGTTLYTVSRILSRWEHEGLVKLGRERVVIRQQHELVTIAGDLVKE